jgi:hypothetical protein
VGLKLDTAKMNLSHFYDTVDNKKLSSILTIAVLPTHRDQYRHTFDEIKIEEYYDDIDRNPACSGSEKTLFFVPC